MGETEGTATKKRILILITDVGFGHRAAALAISEALKRTHPQDCIVEIANLLDDERAPAFLRDGQADYDRMVREMPEWYKIRYEISDSAVPNAIVENTLTVFLYPLIKDIIKRFQPDVIVTTHPNYPAPTSAVLAVNEYNIPFVTVITDLVDVHRLWFSTYADLTLVPTLAVYNQAVNFDLDPDKVQVTGIPIHPDIPEEKRAQVEIRRELGWNETIRTILVAGSKRVKNLDSVLWVLNHSGWNIQLAVVAGGDDELYQHLTEIEWHHPAFLYNYVTNMPSLLCASDLIVSKAGGLIIAEALAASLPLMLIDVTPGQEQPNAEYVIKNGAGRLAETPLDVLETLCHWLDNDGAELKEYQERAGKLSRPLSAFTAADLIWSAAERGPIRVKETTAPMLPKLLELLSSFDIPGREPDTL